MGDVVQLDQKRHRGIAPEYVITKNINGQPTECIDVDLLSVQDRERYFAGTLMNPSRGTWPREVVSFTQPE